MARALYETLAEISSSRAEALLNLGACCIHLEDVEGTRSAFERFLEVAPEDHPHRETVAKDLEALKNGEALTDGEALE